MSKLKEYVDMKVNFMAKFNDQRLIDVDNLTEADASRIYASLDNDLSPENLERDGEATRAEIRDKKALFTGAMYVLNSLGFVHPQSRYG